MQRCRGAVPTLCGARENQEEEEEKGRRGSRLGHGALGSCSEGASFEVPELGFSSQLGSYVKLPWIMLGWVSKADYMFVEDSLTRPTGIFLWLARPFF